MSNVNGKIISVPLIIIIIIITMMTVIIIIITNFFLKTLTLKSHSNGNS